MRDATGGTPGHRFRPDRLAECGQRAFHAAVGVDISEISLSITISFRQLANSEIFASGETAEHYYELLVLRGENIQVIDFAFRRIFRTALGRASPAPMAAPRVFVMMSVMPDT